MISKLRRKFIIISMLSVTLVLTVLIAAINIFNYRKVINNADDVLNILEANEGEFPPDTNPDPPKDGQFGDHGGGRKDHGGEMSPEMRFEVRFFTITFDKNGNVTEIDTGKIAAVDTSNARALAESVYAGGKTKGFEGDYRFRRSENGNETLIVFYDCGRSLDNARSFLGISAVISLIGLLIVFVLIAVSSKAVIRPVAEAYEKQKRFITDAGH
ncbi:MAG: two-component sensor histidine kinase, partial [Clostridiales bacterium]|nr:two-component sensor histidine kinase [Clostridiales bacterium]